MEVWTIEGTHEDLRLGGKQFLDDVGTGWRIGRRRNRNELNITDC